MRLLRLKENKHEAFNLFSFENDNDVENGDESKSNVHLVVMKMLPGFDLSISQRKTRRIRRALVSKLDEIMRETSLINPLLEICKDGKREIQRSEIQLYRPTSVIYNLLFGNTTTNQKSMQLHKSSLKELQFASDWETYYKARGCDNDAVLSSVFSLPLTLFHLIRKLLAKVGASDSRKAFLQNLHVHVVGVDEEVSQAWVLQELALLLSIFPFDFENNENTVKIDYVGIHVSELLDNKIVVIPSKAFGSYETKIVLSFYKGKYHDLVSSKSVYLKSCDLVLLPNAGIELYSTWRETLTLLLKGNNATSVYATDYTEEAANSAAIAARSLFQLGEERENFEVEMNPFGSRPTTHAPGTLLPASENGWLITLRA